MPQDKRTGTITLQEDVATITFERRIPHPIEAVWAAITEPKQRAVWFGATTTLEARVGGTIEMVADGPPSPPEVRHMVGKIRVWEPPRVFEHEWHQRIVGDTVVRYELEADGSTTLLRLTHSRLRPKDAQGYIPGQHAYLDRLEAHLAGAAIPVWTQRYGEVASHYGMTFSVARA